MAPIENAENPEPRAIGVKSGEFIGRKYEYQVFYAFAILSWCLEIVSACLGSLYGGENWQFVGVIVPFMAFHW